MIYDCVGKWLKFSMDIGVKVCEAVFMKVVAAGISEEVRVWDVLKWRSRTYGSGARDG